MGDATGHLAQGAQVPLLQHGLSGLAQVVIGLLQRAVELRLMRGQGDVFAQLPQELALAAAEAVGLPPRRDQDAKHVAFDEQRCRDHRAQAGAGQSLQERHLRLGNV